MSKPHKIGLAIFGLGRAGMIHIQNAVRNPRVCLKWIVEEDLEKAIKIRNDCFLTDSVQIVKADDSMKAFQDKSVEVVIVCTPTAYHSDIILAALKEGKAVFCEKPIAIEEEVVRTCYAAARECGKLLYCALNRRYDPSMREIYTRVKSGEIGQVRSIKTTSRDHPQPSTAFLKISGGIFHDCATHDMDMICWIMGEAPSTIVCQAHSFIPEISALNDVDQVGIMMKFPSGAIAQIDLNRNAYYGYDQRLEDLRLP
ncbi:uncharacterized oxidoreductase YrbE-like isoform X2 [Antedon mediterranea]|uniref:uncharacterized oxidoreductase YrbE-like isoform X2 n=1 Tax=Antedon mediterranea TaxID=105859 RepID=UPI003AF63703